MMLSVKSMQIYKLVTKACISRAAAHLRAEAKQEGGKRVQFDSGAGI